MMRRLVLAALLVAGPVQANPAGTVSSANLDFGSVTVGDSLDLSVTIRSTGDATLHGAVLEGCDDFSIVSGGGAYSLAPGDSQQVTVRFKPAANGTHGCILTTSSCQCSNVTLSGEGIGGMDPVAVCDVSPISLDFGTLVPDSVVTKTFRIKNTGGATLTGSVSEACANYSITSGGGSYALAAAESVIVSVRFTAPAVDGDYPCTIETGGAVLKALAVCDDVAATATVRTPQPLCSIVPASLAFGTLAVGEADTLAAVIKNVGDAGSILSGSVSEGCANYAILSGGADFNLAQGESTTVSVRFSSSSTGTNNCTIDTGPGGCADIAASAFVTSGTDMDSTSFAYLGAFKFGSSLLNEGGGRGLGVLSNGQLIVTGTDAAYGNAVIVTVPTPSLSGDVGSLPIAPTVLNVTDITGGIFGGGDPTTWRWEDIVVMDDRLAILKYPWYDRNYNNSPGLGFCSLALTNPSGPYAVGDPDDGDTDVTSVWYQGKIAGYGVAVPSAYVEGGRTLAIGRVRYEYGPDISAGPALYFVNPDSTADAVVALCYDQSGAVGENNPGPHSRPDYSLTDQVTDMAWIGDTIVFAESKCAYASHYGQPGQTGELGDMGGCVEQNAGYVCGHEGDTPPIYTVQIGFYRAADIMEAAHGVVEPWEPQPYHTWNIHGYMIDPSCQFSLGGMCYDEDAGMLFVIQRSADTNNRPICHVWQVTP